MSMASSRLVTGCTSKTFSSTFFLSNGDFLVGQLFESSYSCVAVSFLTDFEPQPRPSCFQIQEYVHCALCEWSLGALIVAVLIAAV
jgi:hypothetical protein